MKENRQRKIQNRDSINRNKIDELLKPKTNNILLMLIINDVRHTFFCVCVFLFHILVKTIFCKVSFKLRFMLRAWRFWKIFKVMRWLLGWLLFDDATANRKNRTLLLYKRCLVCWWHFYVHASQSLAWMFGRESNDGKIYDLWEFAFFILLTEMNQNISF